MMEDLSTWVPLDEDCGDAASPWLRLHFDEIGGRVECVGLELWAAPLDGNAHSQKTPTPPRGLRALDVRAIKLETHIHAAIERNPDLKARFDQATGGALGARGKYDRAHYERVAEIYAEAVLDGRSPTQSVQEALSVSYPAAANQIARARELNLLPKATGRKYRPELHALDDQDPFAYHRVLGRTQPDIAACYLRADVERLDESAHAQDDNVRRLEQLPPETEPFALCDEARKYSERLHTRLSEARMLVDEITKRLENHGQEAADSTNR
jgi:hypothetical protein